MITSSFYPEYSGAAKQCHNLSKNLISKNFEICVVTFTDDNNLPSKEIIDGLLIKRISINKHILSRVITITKLLYILLKNLREYKIIHFHGFINHMLWVTWFGLIFRKKIIMKISMMDADNPSSIIKKGLVHKISLFMLDKIIATTNSMFDEIYNYPNLKQNAELIPNGVDLKTFNQISLKKKKEIRNHLKLPLEKEIILFSGIISPRKGLDLLYNAWESMKLKNENYPILLLVGPFESDVWKNVKNDYMKEKTNSMIKKHPDEIFHFGMKQEMRKYYQVSDYFILPSKQEGLPNALLEAMSTGLICIINAFTGSDQCIINLKNGLIIDAQDTNFLNQTFNQLRRKKDIVPLIQNNSIDTIKSNYDLEKIAMKYKQLYEQLIK